jgi:sulfhydrogenase subunit beta (sulfur reductase)
MEQYKILDKADFNDFIDRLVKIQKLYAPVRCGEKSFAFQEVASGEEIALRYIPTILPPKKYFLPQNETLVEYDKKQRKWEATLYSESFTVFGVHTCDLAGIQCLNSVFLDPMDANYNMRKKKILIIGLECNDYCDEYASCGLMKNFMPNGGYDLFFTDLEDRFLIHVNTQQGEELAGKMRMLRDATQDDLAELDKLREKKRNIFKPEVDIEYGGLKRLFENAFHADVWKDINDRCLSCANCTNVCPTCYCYDMEDVGDLKGNTGRLVRKWDSCQSRPFAMIAGGENFRPERGGRQRHRYMRKFNYPYDKYRRYFCTGCGRCSRTCMAGINLKETIQTLIDTTGVK